MRYPVKVHADDNGTFLVTFPDVPEAVTYGDTIEEALAHASDALLTAFDACMKDRRDIPPPSPVHTGAAVELPPLECAKIELYRSMRAAKVNKSELARRLDWHMPQVDRVLDVRHASKLDQLDAAFGALGKHLRISVEDAAITPGRSRGVRRGHVGSQRAVSGPMRGTRAVRSRKSTKKR